MKQNRSVARLLSMLELIAKHEEGLTLGQVYRMLDIPKATAYDFLQTLYKQDAIYYKDPRLKNYVIGSKLFAIGSVYTKNSNLIESSEYELKAFARKYESTVFITKRVSDKIIYVFKYQPPNSKVITPQEIGTTTRDFDDSALGQCYRAFDQQVKNDDLPHIAQIRQRLYTESKMTDGSYIKNIAVPVWNFENRVVGVIMSSKLSSLYQDQKQMTIDLVKLAKRISRKQGYTGNFDDK